MVCTDFDRWNYAWAWLAFSDGLFVALLLRRIRYDLRYSWDRGWKEYAQYACFINLNLIRFRIFVGTRPNQILIIIVSNRRKSVVATTRKKFPFPIFLISIAYEESATRGYWNSLSLSLSKLLAHVTITKHVNLAVTWLFTVIGKLDGACRLV